MEQPTKEEVETWKYESAHSPLHDHAFENHNRLICIADAYLALREEKEKDDEKLNGYLDDLYNSKREIEKLKADNQALQGSLVEQRRRMQDEYDGLLDRMAGYRKADADEIKRLKEENQELKADIEKHENGYGYLLATGQAEREEMRKRNRRKDQP